MGIGWFNVRFPPTTWFPILVRQLYDTSGPGVLLTTIAVESKGRRISVLVISEWVLVEQNTERVRFFKYFYTVISRIYIFMANYSCFHIAIYLRFFHKQFTLFEYTFELFILVSKHSKWQCHVTMTWQWGHVTTQILNLAGCGQIRRNQNEWLNHYSPWYFHNLSTYIFYTRVM